MPLQNVISNRLAELVRLDAKANLTVGGLVIEIVIEMIRLDDLDLPDDEFLRLRHSLDDFFLREEAPSGQESPQEIAMRELSCYIGALAAKRIEHPTDDLLSALIEAEADGQKLDLDQVVVTTMTFLTAGFESTNNCFTNLAYALVSTCHSSALHLPVITDCPAGTARAEFCPPGTYCPPGATEAVACPPGRLCDAHGTRRRPRRGGGTRRRRGAARGGRDLLPATPVA